jgi:hypothetical protein
VCRELMGSPPHGRLALGPVPPLGLPLLLGLPPYCRTPYPVRLYPYTVHCTMIVAGSPTNRRSSPAAGGRNRLRPFERVLNRRYGHAARAPSADRPAAVRPILRANLLQIGS